jgi:hypothetical protein
MKGIEFSVTYIPSLQLSRKISNESFTRAKNDFFKMLVLLATNITPNFYRVPLEAQSYPARKQKMLILCSWHEIHSNTSLSIPLLKPGYPSPCPDRWLCGRVYVNPTR